MVSLSSYLSEVSDFRKQNKNYLHDLQDILLQIYVPFFMVQMGMKK